MAFPVNVNDEVHDPDCPKAKGAFLGRAFSQGLGRGVVKEIFTNNEDKPLCFLVDFECQKNAVMFDVNGVRWDRVGIPGAKKLEFREESTTQPKEPVDGVVHRQGSLF